MTPSTIDSQTLAVVGEAPELAKTTTSRSDREVVALAKHEAILPQLATDPLGVAAHCARMAVQGAIISTFYRVLAGTALAQAPSGKLVLYTSQPQKDAQETIAAFTKAVPGVQVDFVRDGTTQLMSKLRAEFAAGAPQPDLLLIADAMTMEQLKA